MITRVVNRLSAANSRERSRSIRRGLLGLSRRLRRGALGLPGLVVGTLLLSSVRAEIDFAHQVVPILKARCAECHAGQSKKGGFSLNDREALLRGSENGEMVTVGKSSESYLIELVTAKDADSRMPPKGEPLSEAEVSILRQWIDQGLSWQEGFAFEKGAYEPPLFPRKPELPPAVADRQHPIDRIIDRYYLEHTIAPPAAIDDRVFARRSSLDLVGLLPSDERVATFLADTGKDKRRRWIDELLSDDIGYADHWLTFWNDLLRNDYSGTGFITGGRKQISSWLYEALRANKPFDQFTRELIAPPNDESRGFIDGIKWRGDVSAGQTVEIQFAQSVAQSFLGINMKCASCHDSFIDRWKLSEAYSLAAVYSTRPLEIARCDKSTGVEAKAGWLFPEIGSIDPEAPPAERLTQLAELMTSPQNGRYARTIANRMWHRMMGRGIVHPVDAMQTEPWNADLLDYLASYLVDQRYDLRRLLTHIADSQAYQSTAQIYPADAATREYRFTGPYAKRMTAEQFVDAVWSFTGAAPKKFDAPIFRGKIDPALRDSLKPTGRQLWGEYAAEATEDQKKKPFLFRKAFKLEGDILSAGMVITANRAFTLYVNNRQVMQDADWRSIEMVPIHHLLRSGNNSIAVFVEGPTNSPTSGSFFGEALIRMADDRVITIPTDETWECTQDAPPAKEKRLTAMDKELFKPAKVLPASPGWQKTLEPQAMFLYPRAVAVDDRMIRAALIRSNFLMRTLGRPNRDQIVSMRPNELSTLEAIDLANGQTLADMMAIGAKNILNEPWKSVDELVQTLYRRILTRPPTAEELSVALEMIGETAEAMEIEDLLWALSMSPEFQYVR